MFKVKKHHDNWSEKRDAAKLWLRELGKEVDAPDLWATIGQEYALSTAVSATLDNEPFTAAEQYLIATKLDEIKGHILEGQQFAADQAGIRGGAVRILQGSVRSPGPEGLVEHTVRWIDNRDCRCRPRTRCGKSSPTAGSGGVPVVVGDDARAIALVRCHQLRGQREEVEGPVAGRWCSEDRDGREGAERTEPQSKTGDTTAALELHDA